jgi:hypothetical protein
MKKSFIIHNDSVEVLEKLSDEQAGILFKAICAYQNACVAHLDYPLDLVFLPFQKQFDRDNEKYENTCKQRALAGSKGGKQKVANASKCKQKVANVADSDSDSKNDSKNDSKIFDTFWYNYPKKTDRKRAVQAFSKLNAANAKLATEDCKVRFTGTDKKYIPNPTTYLNGERWNDELPTGVAQEQKGYYGGVKWQ